MQIVPAAWMRSPAQQEQRKRRERDDEDTCPISVSIIPESELFDNSAIDNTAHRGYNSRKHVWVKEKGIC
jgi:hypothetical protein